MNDLFSSILTSLNLLESQNAYPLSDNIDHPTQKVTVKWRNHPSVLAISDYNGIRTHLGRKRALNHLAKLPK